MKPTYTHYSSDDNNYIYIPEYYDDITYFTKNCDDGSIYVKSLELLKELVNTPPIKIPIWIKQHVDVLKSLGITIKNDV